MSIVNIIGNQNRIIYRYLHQDRLYIGVLDLRMLLLIAGNGGILTQKQLFGSRSPMFLHGSLISQRTRGRAGRKINAGSALKRLVERNFLIECEKPRSYSLAPDGLILVKEFEAFAEKFLNELNVNKG